MRFLAFVELDADTGCWLWTGNCCKKGYGRFWWRGDSTGRIVGPGRASVASLRAAFRPITAGSVPGIVLTRIT
jgi:hypothetical protein